MSNPDETLSVINGISFLNFCNLCEKVSHKKDKKIKIEILRRHFVSLRSKTNNGNLYPLMRLLLPDLERERGPYGIKEYHLANIFIKILGLPKESKDALKLRNYRHPSNCKSNDSFGDFAEVAYWVLLNRCGTTTGASIGDINQSLDEISEKHSEHLPNEVKDVFVKMILNLSPEEQKWFIRLVLKKMHLGVGVNQILSCFHRDAVEVLDFSCSLLKVCTMLLNPEQRYHEMTISLFQPFRSMLSEVCRVDSFKFTGGNYIFETKFDGERFQLHYDRGEFKYFSRNGYEYTNSYGSNAVSGSYTSRIIKKINPSCKSAILDGEMMSWSKSDSCFIKKGRLVDVKHLASNSNIQPCFCVFDIVFYNGEVLTNKPLHERISILKNVFEPELGVIMHSQRASVNTNDELLAALNAAIDKRDEGIVVKDISSVYKPNARNNSGWFKIKPEYTIGALTELDLLIIGGFYGEGRHKGVINNFVVALSHGNEQGNLQNFEAISRVKNGFSDEELEELRLKLGPHWKPYRKDLLPISHTFGRIVPDVYIEPVNSCVVQVKASQVDPSKFYYSGYTLKFPRVECIRFDKLWQDCLTSKQFHEINKNFGMLTQGHISGRGASKGTKRKSTVEMLPVYSKKAICNIEKTSNVFMGKEFCVVSGSAKYSKQYLENLIIQHGGKIVINPGSNTFCLIGADITLRLKNFIRARRHVIATCSWVLDCISEEKILPWTPGNILAITPDEENIMLQHYDKFGDNYFELSTQESLEDIFSKINYENYEDLMTDDVFNSLDELLFSGTSPYSFFRGCTAYFAESEVNEHLLKQQLKLKRVRILFEFYCGIEHKELQESTRYIITENIQNLPIDKRIKENGCAAQIVSSNWIIDCYNAGNLIPTNDYILD